MKILGIAIVAEGYPHLCDKMAFQIRTLRNIGYNAVGYIIGCSASSTFHKSELKFIPCPYDRRIMFDMCRNVVETLKPDVVFFRYPLADYNLYSFLRNVKAKVVFEHNTKEIEELALTNSYMKDEEIKWGPLCLEMASGLVCVTGEILSYERKRGAKDIPGIVCGNAIDVKEYKQLESIEFHDHLKMIVTAKFAPWHGLERVLYGLAEYHGDIKITLHVAGDNVDSYVRLAHKLGISDRVIFHGFLSKDKLDFLYAQSHVAIGPLAHHRIGLSEISSIKNREYAARAIPFIYAGYDPDFPHGLSFVHVFPLGEDAIDIEGIIAFAKRSNEDFRVRWFERIYAENNITWEKKMTEVGKFIESLHTKSNAYIPVCDKLQFLSVIITYCDRDIKNLIATFYNIFNQTWNDIEIILIDGSGTNETPVLTAELFRRFHNLKAKVRLRLVQQKRKGLAEARNVGIAESSGDWILLLEPNHVLDPDFITIAMQEIRNNTEINLLYSWIQDYKNASKAQLFKIPSFDELKKENVIPGTVLFKKELWQAVGGYDPSHPWGFEDWNFWLRCATNIGLTVKRLRYYGIYRNVGSGDVASFDGLKEHWEESLAMHYSMLYYIYDFKEVVASMNSISCISDNTYNQLVEKIELFPHLPFPYFWLGLKYEKEGDFDNALVLFHKATDLADPNNWQPYLKLAGIYKRLGITGTAKEFMKVANERIKIASKLRLDVHFRYLE